MIRWRGLFSMEASGVCLLLILTMGTSRWASYRRGGRLTVLLETIPQQLSGFSGTTNPPLSEGVLRELNATSYISRQYTKNGLNADVFVAYYGRQRAGESMHSPKHCLPGAGWEIWNSYCIDIPAGGKSFRVNQYSISHASDRRVVLYWYQSRNRVFASEYLGKLLLARDALLQNSTAAAIVRVTVPDEPRAVKEGIGLSSEMILQMQRCFGP